MSETTHAGSHTQPETEQRLEHSSDSKGFFFPSSPPSVASWRGTKRWVLWLSFYNCSLSKLLSAGKTYPSGSLWKFWPQVGPL